MLVKKESVCSCDKSPQLHIGIGCRRGISEAALCEAVKKVLEENGINWDEIQCAASIDLKADEEGLLQFCKNQHWPIRFYSAEELQKVKGAFSVSPFVQRVTGVDNVCERAALMQADQLIVKKTAWKGVTVAVAAPYVLGNRQFPEERDIKMEKLCIFAGTTEGRRVVEYLSGQPVQVTACVATEYGEMLLSPAENLTISTQRMTEEEMVTLFRVNRFSLVVDATHPYAAAVTENIAAACADTGTPYLRLLRDGAEVPEGAVYVPDIPGAVEFLNRVEGNILLTTGSKELSRYTGVREFSRRVYARVLPMDESLAACRAAGLTPSHIIAMQGPFSKEMNSAMLQFVQAQYLVTKEDGGAGGFGEKVAAAAETGARLVVIGRPPQREGLSYAAAVDLLNQRFGLIRRPQVTVVGIGPGHAKAMTEEVRSALAEADCVIGARRMLADVGRERAVFESISPVDIAAYIKKHPEFQRFTIAMSGDVGFFSGTKKLLPLLKECQVDVLPGVSSLAYLCARLHTSYENVIAVSGHGREVDISAAIRTNRRVFVLVGGENGAAHVCRRLTEASLGGIYVAVGERLSYSDERVTTGTAQKLAERSFSTLSALLLQWEPFESK